MIIDVKKYLILGTKEDIDRFFDRAQQKGIIEFISPFTKKPLEVPLEIQHLHDAMRVLRKLPVKKVYEGPRELPLAEETALRILELKTEIERLTEEKRLTAAEISRVAPFGDFSLDDIDFIEREGHFEIQFFCMKTAKANAMLVPDTLFHVGTDYDLDYFVSISSKHESYPEMVEMRIDRPYGELKSHLHFTAESLHQLEAELKGYAGHIDFLNEALVEHLNTFHLALAKKEVSFPIEHTNLFAVEAWVPVNKVNLLYSIIDGMAIHCEPILIEEHDRIPTQMENRGIQKIGEDLVRIYDVPASTDNDPSGWVFWFFALFFAMIVADGGYGLMYLGLCLYLKFKMPIKSRATKRYLKLATILSTACILWGVCTSSFFGLEIKPNSWIGELSGVRYLAIQKADYHFAQGDDVKKEWVARYSGLTNLTSGKEILDGATKVSGEKVTYEMYDAFSDSILLELSLIIGVIHIACGLLRYLFRNWSAIGWIAFMAGAYMYFPKILNSTSILTVLGIFDKTTGPEIGLQLIYTGIIAALALALIQKRLKGLAEISNLVQIFADVLSYLRLYALGLAGSIMAKNFNEMGQNVGLFLGVLVIVFGHGVNILLGIMAGVIHGLRLNFIEWYHYCFDGGGRLFRPLMRLKSKDQ